MKCKFVYYYNSGELIYTEENENITIRLGKHGGSHCVWDSTKSSQQEIDEITSHLESYIKIKDLIAYFDALWQQKK